MIKTIVNPTMLTVQILIEFVPANFFSLIFFQQVQPVSNVFNNRTFFVNITDVQIQMYGGKITDS